jgi:hypothetical protein
LTPITVVLACSAFTRFTEIRRCSQDHENHKESRSARNNPIVPGRCDSRDDVGNHHGQRSSITVACSPLDDVNRYGHEAFRRLTLKPGMTGLWQVEGRSALNWREALQLDLYYVERWSLAGDLVLLGRTLGAVVRGTGAH